MISALGPEASRTATIVVAADGSMRTLASPALISDVLANESEAFVWFDVVAPDARDFALIAEEFAMHPLAIEDALARHQRPKIEAYGETWFVVVQAATRRDTHLGLHEVAIFVGRRFAVTVRADAGYPLDEFARRWAHKPMPGRADGASFLYTLLDTIVDGYVPIGEAFEDRVERLEVELLAAGARTDAILREIFAMKKSLAAFRRAIVPVRDLLTPVMRGDLVFFAGHPDELPYYRDVYDHVARVVDGLDAARDSINNARDTHVALATNRQNEVAKQLTIVATVFLPLTFLTGFFGQNFAFLVNHITAAGTFWWLGIGSEVAALAALLAYFRYKHWF
ncbi:MAG: magnesium transporter CorA family protein [Vulcanimicrobiaceae bacterium]